MQKSTLIQPEVTYPLIHEARLFTNLSWTIAIIASQSRLVQVMEKLYGDNAFNNAALAEYKRAIEALEKESKDNLVSENWVLLECGNRLFMRNNNT